MRPAKIPGLTLRTFPSGRAAYYLYYRTHDGTERRPKLGNCPPMTQTQAERIAKQMLARVALGGDPASDRQQAREALTVAQLWERYEAEHLPRKKPRSQANDRSIFKLHILPRWGGRKVASLTASDVSQLHASLAKTPVNANRVLEVVRKAFNLAELWGIIPKGGNPTEGISKFKEQKRRRFLSVEEIYRLAAALDKKEASQPFMVALVRLLILTGARLSEIRTAQWDWYRGGILDLPDSKTGARYIILSEAAQSILNTLPRMNGNPFIIPSLVRTGQPLNRTTELWREICAEAGLKNVRIHDLRHTFASAAVATGSSLHLIGGLLGHSQAQTTMRYTHLQDTQLREASERAAGYLLPRKETAEPAKE